MDRDGFDGGRTIQILFYFGSTMSTLSEFRRLIFTCVLMMSLTYQARADFFSNADGTVTDSVTNLVWDQCALGQSSSLGPLLSCIGTGTKFNFSQALNQVVALNTMNSGAGYKGHTDWRLPNRNEVESLVDRARNNPAINREFFPNTPYGSADRFWSSTVYAPTESKAWVVDFSSGNSLSYPRTSFNYVRIVRGGGYSGFDAENSKSFQAPLVLHVDPSSILSGGSAALLSYTGGSTGGLVAFQTAGSTGLKCEVTDKLLTATGGPGNCYVIGVMAGDSNYESATSSVLTVPVIGGLMQGLAAQGFVGTDNQVQFGAFTISGASRKVLIKGLGPALSAFIPGAIADPKISLSFNGVSTPIEINDNWLDAINSQEISDLGFAPKNATESAILITLEPGIYNVHLSGAGGATGIGMFQIYPVDGGGNGVLTGLGGQGFVGTDNQVQFGTFTVSGASRKILVRGLGPALSAFIPGAIADPQITLSINGVATPMETNDDWKDAANAQEISDLGFAPKNSTESAILIRLDPGIYNVHLKGAKGETGIGMFQIYPVQ